MTSESKSTTIPRWTHSCESSRAPKNSTQLLKQHLNAEKHPAKYKALVDAMSSFHVRPLARETTEVSTLYTSPFSATRRVGTESRTRDDLRIRVSLHLENKINVRPSTQELTQNMLFTVEPGTAKKSTMQRTCHCTTQVHQQLVSVLHNKEQRQLSLHTLAHNELVQELELHNHLVVDELNLGHLHSYRSHGGCHWEWFVSRFSQHELSTVSNRTHAWPQGTKLRPQVRSDLRTFFEDWEKCEKPFTRLIRHTIRTSWRVKRRRRWRTLSRANWNANHLLHNPLRNAFLGKVRRC